MSGSGGKILWEHAYAQGKMLDHSSWDLPRNITPSDVDMFFDNRGSIVYCEVSSQCVSWQQLEQGQRWGYESIIKGTSDLAVLCKHSVAVDKQIDTRYDINAFQVQVFNNETGGFEVAKVVTGNRYWQKFISNFYANPRRLRAAILRRCKSEKREAA